MSTISHTYQTALRGQALHDAVDRMVRGIVGRPPYSSFHPSVTWAGNVLSLSASSSGRQVMSGTASLQDGTTPSTVAVNITISPSLDALGARNAVERELASASAQLAPAGGQPGPADTTSTRQAPAEGGRSGFDLSTLTEIVQSAGEALPALVGQVRETIEEATAAARGQDIVKPGTRAPHAPDVAEAIPLWQRSWVRWTLGAVVVGGAGYLVYKAVR